MLRRDRCDRDLIIEVEDLPQSINQSINIDFIFNKKLEAEQSKQVIADISKKWNLLCNQTKTKITEVERADEEEWRKDRKLGSLIGDEEDIN